ncbi:NmrA family transcriptional regulator [Leptospira ognonensis]|uniref:NmrA family transcriptional regulator n=1 Tax=Leptospira ognonensis TaxID=2484945 RepID=A0A4R9JWW3_9LEPT|nr:NAD(P)H-binding protein [Leptospira ognonensis]TGL56997.1 NmrA family transcriptional regulator [Leptospira ognonensis]
MKPLTLVTGSNGKTGSRILSRLIQSEYPVRLGSRIANPTFDWEKPQTWDAVLKGVNQVYISFQPDLAIPSALESIKLFVNRCKAHQVNRLVLLSGRGEPECVESERVVQNSGLEWTILRSSWFNQNFSEGMFLDQILDGKVLFPIITVKEPFVDIDDLADLAFAALVTNKHVNKLYELTGSELWDFKKAFQLIADETHQEIPIEEVPLSTYLSALKDFGLPKETLDFIEYLFITVFDGRNESILKDMELALGRKTKNFKSYVEETAKTGIWKLREKIT